MISGFLYSEKNSSDLKSVLFFIWKKIKGLYVPFLFWNTVWLLCNNLFVEVGFYNNVPLMKFEEIVRNEVNNILFIGETQMGGAYWFLRVLFAISLFYVLIDWAITKLGLNHVGRVIAQGVVAVSLFALGFYIGDKSIRLHGLGSSCTAYILFYIGKLLKEAREGRFRIGQGRTLGCNKVVFNFIISVCSCGLLIVTGMFGYVNLSANEYSGMIYLVIVSILGFLLVANLAKLIGRSILLSKTVSYIGKNSIQVLLFHFLSFKIVNIIQIVITHASWDQLGCHPVMNGRDGWWGVYLLIGIIMPLFMNYLYRLICQKVVSVKCQ